MSAPLSKELREKVDNIVQDRIKEYTDIICSTMCAQWRSEKTTKSPLFEAHTRAVRARSLQFTDSNVRKIGA